LRRLAPGEDKKALHQQLQIILDEAVQGRIVRAVEGPRQLQEVMAAFWFNHFNVFAGKGLCRLWVGCFEQEAIRPHTMGRFRELLGATAKHPAMLFYLDNWQNTGPPSPGTRVKFEGINENYARELMELHTLGVNGGYSQADVIALAHILTGWGLFARSNVASLFNRRFPSGAAISPRAFGFRPFLFGRWLQDSRPRTLPEDLEAKMDSVSIPDAMILAHKVFSAGGSPVVVSNRAKLRWISSPAAQRPRII